METAEATRPPAIPTEFRAVIRNGADPAEFRSDRFSGKSPEEVLRAIEAGGNHIEAILPGDGPAVLAHEIPVGRWVPFPIIRCPGKRKSFQSGFPDSAGLFRDGLVLFRNGRGTELPEQAFATESSEGMAKIPWARQIRFFSWAGIDSLIAVRKGTEARFSLSVGKRRVTFSIPLKDARSIVEGCACFLGQRFQSSLNKEDFFVREISGRKRTMFGIIAFVLSALALGWGVRVMFAGVDIIGLGSIAIQYGTLGSLFSLLLLGGQWMKRPSKRPAGVEPYRSRPLSLALRILGIAVFLVGYLAPEFTLGIFGLENEVENIPVLFALSVVTTSLGALFLYSGYRVGLGTKQSAAEKDDRLPVLYLRSFGDDGRNSLNPDGFFSKMLGLRPFDFLENFGPIAHAYPPRMVKLLFGFAADTAEEQLGNYFRKQGPFRAIGKPGERLVTGGAERMYVAHDAWQDRVLELMDSSRAVVLQPAATEGVWWEIGKAIDRVTPQRLILCLANFRDSAQDYEDFRQRFGKLVGAKLPRSLGKAQFMFFTDTAWTPRLLDSIPRNPLLWPALGVGIDIGKTLHPFLSRLPDPPPGLPEKVDGKAGWIWPRALAAVFLWGLIPFAGIFAFKTLMGARGIYERALADDGFEIRQEYPGYSWKLGQGWTELQAGADGSRVFASENQAVIATVGVTPASDTTEGLLESQLAILDKISVDAPEIAEKRSVTIEGRKWIMAEVRSRLFSQDDLQSFIMHANLQNLSASIMGAVDPEASVAQTAAINTPFRESLDPSDLSEKAKSGQDFVHYVACHAGEQNDFSLRMSADARGSRLGGATREAFLTRMRGFRILAEISKEGGGEPSAISDESTQTDEERPMINLTRYEGIAVPYICELSGFWEHIDIEMEGTDMFWVGRGVGEFKVDVLKEGFHPADQAGIVARLREQFAGKSEVGEAVAAGDWTRFRMETRSEEGSTSTFLAVRVTSSGLCIATVAFPTEEVDHYKAEIEAALGSIDFPE